MKNLVLSIVMSIVSISLFAQNKSAGKVFNSTKMFSEVGKPFTLGSDKSMDIVLESTKAYNALDLEKYLNFGVYTNEQKEFQKNWFNSLTKVEEKPYLILPLRVEGAKDDVVMVIAEENREYKNGSKEKLYVVELNKINADGKLTEFNQFTSIPAANEFGKTYGGKYYGKKPGENTGKSFEFSNRGEVAIIEKMAVDYNKLDIPAFLSAFTEKITLNLDGKDLIVTKKELENMMAVYKALDWKLISILPIKIKDTDPASGVMVYSTEKRTHKDGKIEEFEFMETFYFDLNGKISYLNQFSKKLN